MSYKRRNILQYSIIVLVLGLAAGCTPVKTENIPAKNGAKSTVTLTSSCGKNCSDSIYKLLSLKKRLYKGDVVSSTDLLSVDGKYAEYASSWTKSYKVTVTDGLHKLTTLPSFCNSKSEEKVFSFNSVAGNTYFIGNAILDKGSSRRGGPIYSWTPIVYNLNTQKLIYPVDKDTWKKDVQVGSASCIY